MTHALFRPLNFTTIILLAIWTFSPLGTRVNPATLSLDFYPHSTDHTIQYMETMGTSKMSGPDGSLAHPPSAGPSWDLYICRI